MKGALRAQRCDVEPGRPYDDGSAVEFEHGERIVFFCCYRPRHGPCGLTAIRRVDGQWRAIGSFEGFREEGNACPGFMRFLAHTSHGLPDICMSSGPPTGQARVWRFNGAEYSR
jgi:hypothetical protein